MPHKGFPGNLPLNTTINTKIMAKTNPPKLEQIVLIFVGLKFMSINDDDNHL